MGHSARVVDQGEDCLFRFLELFVQPTPRYGIKAPGATAWRTQWGSISRNLVLKHLAGEVQIASLGRWYPPIATLDIDGRGLDEVAIIRESIGLDQRNSLLCRSESLDSYHLFFAPRYAGTPATISLLHAALDERCSELGVELYPQELKAFRLPFGPLQSCLDSDYEGIGWKEQLDIVQALSPFDIGSIPRIGPMTSLGPRRTRRIGGTLFSNCHSVGSVGQEYLKTGLVEFHSRYRAQFEMLHFLWQCGEEEVEAVPIVQKWIRGKHNGYSKQVLLGEWRRIDGEIIRQARRIWSTYRRPVIPSSTISGIRSEGVPKEDLPCILAACEGSLPLAKFFYRILCYAYPRVGKGSALRIHSRLLITFSSRGSYQDLLDRLERLGLIERGDAYLEGQESKSIEIDWRFHRTSEFFLIDGRAPPDFLEAIAMAYGNSELEDILKELKLSTSERRRIGRHADTLRQLRINKEINI